MTDYLCLLLPFPPSVNHLYGNNRRTGGRYRTKHYDAWIEEAGHMLNQQRPPHIPGKVKVIYALGRPDKRVRDSFNYEKALSDILVRHNVIEDDSYIEDGRIYWADDVVNGCRIEVEAA